MVGIWKKKLSNEKKVEPPFELSVFDQNRVKLIAADPPTSKSETTSNTCSGPCLNVLKHPVWTTNQTG